MIEREHELLAAGIIDVLRPLVAQLVEEEVARRLGEPVEWLTVEQYAQLQHTTPAAIHKRLERSRVPGAIREGKRWLIPAQGAVTIAAHSNQRGERRANDLAPGTGGRSSHA